MLLRSFFEKSFVDQVLAAHPNISMVRFLVEYADREIRSYWETLHGLGSTTETLVRKADSTMVVLRTLLDRLGLDANHGIHPVDLNFRLAPP